MSLKYLENYFRKLFHWLFIIFIDSVYYNVGASMYSYSKFRQHRFKPDLETMKTRQAFININHQFEDPGNQIFQPFQERKMRRRETHKKSSVPFAQTQ